MELNRIISELLNSKSGDESIINSVEELQKQLNEQQSWIIINFIVNSVTNILFLDTILEINTILAEKSRENSELHLMIAEQNARLNGEIASLKQDNDELESEKSILRTTLDDTKKEYEEHITKALEGKNSEIKRLQFDYTALQQNCEGEYTKRQTALAKVQVYIIYINKNLLY